ncbi:MAG: glycosyl hydrolase family 18 protein [Eubacteriales bacterium]
MRNKNMRKSNTRKRNMRKRQKQDPVRIVLLLAAAVALIGIISFAAGRFIPTSSKRDPKEYFGIEGRDEVGVVVNGHVFEAPGITLNEEIYLPIDEVSKYLNPGFFYSENENMFIITTPVEKIAVSVADSAEQNLFVSRDGKNYISYNYLYQYTDMDGDVVLGDTDRIVIRTVFDYDMRTVGEKAVVRERPTIRGLVLEKPEAGTQVSILEPDGSMDAGTWTHVTTPTGYTGYIENKYLEGDMIHVTEDRVRPELIYTHILREDKINMVFHQTDNQASNNMLAQSLEGVSGVNVIAPTWFYLESPEGDMSSVASDTYVATAHSRGLSVWTVANDFDGAVNSSKDTFSALSTYAGRSKIIDTIVSETVRVGADGINIDFEKVNADCAPYFQEFIRELSVSCRTQGLVLSIDAYVPTYTKYLGRAELARTADYVVCMCYDEHTSGSETAGSVSSLPFVQKGIRDTLKEVPPEQTVIALPFFTRLWKVNENAAPASSAMGMGEAAAWLSENAANVVWDEETGQNYAEAKGVDGTSKIWIEDAQSISEKMKEVMAAGCAGVAEWKLGLETQDIWQVISEHLAEG